MSEIRRETLFGKLNVVAYQTIEGASLLCKLRGNPYVELIHWVHQLLEHPQADFRRIAVAFQLDAARLAADLTAALDQLPRGSTAVHDLSPQVDRAVERAWTYASLLFGTTRVRTGHVLFAALKAPELSPALRAISREFDKIGPDALFERFAALLESAPEGKLEAKTSLQAAVPAGAAGQQGALASYAVDLTARARAGEIDPVVGRDAEMRQMIDILMRRRQNNPLLTGEAGVGKTAVVEGLALRIARGEVPAPLREVALHALDLGLLQAGASMKGEFEQRLRQVIDEVQASTTPVILFIDEAHTLIGAGGAVGTGDAANLLKPALARGRLRTIAATTWAEYKKHIEPDPALTRRFEVVSVDEPSEALALRMLRALVGTLETHHRVPVLDEALEAAVRLSLRYIPARQLPDKAVSLLDTACARVAVGMHATPAPIEDCQRTLDALEIELGILAREAQAGGDVDAQRKHAEAEREREHARLQELTVRFGEERALVERIIGLRASLQRNGGETAHAALRDEHRRLERELRALQGDAPLLTPTVDRQTIGTVISEWTGIPIGRMVRDELTAVLALPETLSRRVLGQAHALEMIGRRVQTTRAGLEDPHKPIGVFLLAGPSGVGKTETALALSETLFGSEQSLITINMSEFQEAHTVSTLKGAPPGYVGYGKGGVLTEAVRRRPYSVVLLDEIEKAHPDVHELFFQVFDKGVMEDGEGRSIDFKNTLILLTTNVGSELIMEACADPRGRPVADSLAAALREPLLEVFPPALLGRMVTLPYYPLGETLIREVVQLQLARVRARVAERHGVPLDYDDAVPAWLTARCSEPESGARLVGTLLSNTLLPRLSHAFLSRMLQGTPLTAVRVGVEQGELACAFT